MSHLRKTLLHYLDREKPKKMSFKQHYALEKALSGAKKRRGSYTREQMYDTLKKGIARKSMRRKSIGGRRSRRRYTRRRSRH